MGPPTARHLRSLSVESNFFHGLGFVDGDNERVAEKSGDKRRVGHHRHNNSMDGSLTTSFEVNSTMVMMDGVKKSMTPDKLFKLAITNPKRATRTHANRQSAARSKERMIRYASELEKKVQTLQTQQTNLSQQLTVLKKENTDLTAEYEELKIELEALEQEAQLTEDLKQALKEKRQRLRAQLLVTLLSEG
ncbi:Transcription factor VIP1 [Spatholobus suberectus]|nr:Transcription factor VIP1 [Spatholobus suberectus]